MVALHKMATVQEGDLFESNYNLFRSTAGLLIKWKGKSFFTCSEHTSECAGWSF